MSGPSSLALSSSTSPILSCRREYAIATREIGSLADVVVAPLGAQQLGACRPTTAIYLDRQQAAGLEHPCCLLGQRRDHRHAAVARVERGGRLPIPHARRQLPHLAIRD